MEGLGCPSRYRPKLPSGNQVINGRLNVIFSWESPAIKVVLIAAFHGWGLSWTGGRNILFGLGNIISLS